MTPQEAIERIAIIIKNLRFTRADKSALILAKSVLEKQTPQKVKPKQRGKSTDYCCPHCGSRIRVTNNGFWMGGYEDKFCRYCGQGLLWEGDAE